MHGELQDEVGQKNLIHEDLLNEAAASEIHPVTSRDSTVQSKIMSSFHGSFGVSLDFARLHQCEDGARRTMALGPISDRGVFAIVPFRTLSNQNQNETVVCAMAWCHGAPGIGLSRLRAYELTGDVLCREEAEAAIRTTAKMLSAAMHGGQDNFSLCHALSGNADLLIYASQVLEDESHLSLVNQIGEMGIARYRKAKLPWPCGVPQAGESPNLMMGLAGIGYFYLRLLRLRKASICVDNGAARLDFFLG